MLLKCLLLNLNQIDSSNKVKRIKNDIYFNFKTSILKHMSQVHIVRLWRRLHFNVVLKLLSDFIFFTILNLLNHKHD